MKIITIMVPDKAEQYVFKAVADDRIMPPGVDLIVQNGYIPDDLVSRALSGLGNWCFDTIKSSIGLEEYEKAVAIFGPSRNKRELDLFNATLKASIEAALTAAITDLSTEGNRVQISISDQL